MDSDDAREMSPLNTPLPAKDEDQPGSSSMYTTDAAVESEGEFTSYQPPKQRSTKQQRNKGERKRKAETENLYAVQARMKRTEDSIKKLEEHIGQDLSQVTALQRTGKYPAGRRIQKRHSSGETESGARFFISSN